MLFSCHMWLRQAQLSGDLASNMPSFGTLCSLLFLAVVPYLYQQWDIASSSPIPSPTMAQDHVPSANTELANIGVLPGHKAFVHF